MVICLKTRGLSEKGNIWKQRLVYWPSYVSSSYTICVILQLAEDRCWISSLVVIGVCLLSSYWSKNSLSAWNLMIGAMPVSHTMWASLDLRYSIYYYRKSLLFQILSYPWILILGWIFWFILMIFNHIRTCLRVQVNFSMDQLITASSGSTWAGYQLLAKMG